MIPFTADNFAEWFGWTVIVFLGAVLLLCVAGGLAFAFFGPKKPAPDTYEDDVIRRWRAPLVIESCMRALSRPRAFVPRDANELWREPDGDDCADVTETEPRGDA